jgi:hypothetical protein
MGPTTTHRDLRYYMQDATTALSLGLVAALVFLFAPAKAIAADLKPETLQAWDEYVKTLNIEMQDHLRPDHPFLLTDEAPDRSARLRSGEIVVSPAGPNIPKRVPSGLIHDWIGVAFIPNATIHDVLPVVRDYQHYKDMYHPGVIDSKAITIAESEDRFSMLLMNKSVVSKTALDGEYRSSYVCVDDHRWYSVSETIRIQEIAGYGTRNQHMLPEDQGTGLIWRIHSVTRFEEGDGGVYIELEALVLSRDIPGSLRWFVEPIVKRVSRESLETSLHQTQEAVRSAAKLAGRDARDPRCPDGSPCASTSSGENANRSFR